MAIQTEDGISWCDETINMWWGCSRVHGSPACEDPNDPTKIVCYAERDVRRYGYNDLPDAAHFPIWGDRAQRRFFDDKPFDRLRAMDKRWNNKERRGRAFVMSFGDWAEGRPDQQPYLEKLWKLWIGYKNVDGLFLTKRPQLISKLCAFSRSRFDDFCVLNFDPAAYGQMTEATKRIWQGTTAENQHWLDIRWPFLRDSWWDDRIAWLSIEPQVGPITLPQDFLDRGQRAWVVVGGQSGKDAVRFDPQWARHLRDQCREANVPFHCKQLSGSTKKELQNIPQDLLIREWPNGI